jgi:ribosomal protein L34
LSSSPTTTTYNPSRSSATKMVGFLSRQLSSSTTTTNGVKTAPPVANGGLFTAAQQQRRSINDRSGQNAAAAFYEPSA